MKKLPRDAEASNVLVGEVDFLDAPFVAFVRLQQAVMLGALTEVPVPTRWLRFMSGSDLLTEGVMQEDAPVQNFIRDGWSV